MRQMSSQDAAFIYGETPNWHMHICGLVIVDPSGNPEGWSFDRFMELFVGRMVELPQLRYRLIESPLGLDRPGWVDTEPDLEYHVRRVAVPQPGDARELGTMIGRIASYKLNRAKPLWEAWVIEGLEGGRVALLQKMHHSLIDGVSGAGLAEVLLDLTPEPRAPNLDAAHGRADDRVPRPGELLARGLVNSWVRTPVRMARFAGQSIRQVASAVPMASGSAVKLPMQAPRTQFNADPTPHRRFANASVALDRVKDLKHRYDVKVNDIVLALCATTMRNYLLARDGLPDAPMTAQVPVSMRVEGDAAGGNKVGSMTASLATDIAEPVDRLAAIAASTAAAKEMRQAMAVHQIMGVTETTPPGLIALAARMYTRNNLARYTPPASNVVISNVPGPDFPLYLAGSPVDSIYPMGPLIMGMSLNITVFSYRDHIDFGFLVCPESIPDPWELANGIESAVAELEKAVKNKTAAKRTKKPAR